MSLKITSWLLKHKFLTILIVIVLFLLPLIIVHFLFKWDSS